MDMTTIAMEADNRRSSDRITSIGELLVYFKPADLFAFLMPYKELKIVDFYTTGLGFTLNNSLELYDKIKLDITLRSKSCNHLVGVIAHKKPLKDEHYRYGLKFLNVEPATQKTLNEIASMLS